MHDQDQHITLGEASKITPGRPSTNCVWRWCRKGVLARSGERVRLQHVRIGGKIFTTPAWVQQFGKALAEADAAHFELDEQGTEVPRQAPRRRRRVSRHAQQRRDAYERANRELEEAGL